jgi:hypothetical protein
MIASRMTEYSHLTTCLRIERNNALNAPAVAPKLQTIVVITKDMISIHTAAKIVQQAEDTFQNHTCITFLYVGGATRLLMTLAA